jgi:hypothetical protein
MDASVELNYPVDVVVSAAAKKNKSFVMGSDEVFGRDNNNDNNDNIRVSTLVGKEVVEVEESILVNPRAAAVSIQHCSSLFAQKGLSFTLFFEFLTLYKNFLYTHTHTFLNSLFLILNKNSLFFDLIFWLLVVWVCGLLR